MSAATAASPVFPSTDPICIMGVRIDVVTNSQTLDIIDHMVGSRRPHHVVTANLNFLAQAQREVELRRVLLESQLVVCDGTPLLWIAKGLRHPLPERVAGSDLVPQLLTRSAQRGHRLFFLGSTPEILNRCVENVRALHPSLPEPGFYAPPFASLVNMDHEEICKRVKSFAPDILLVAMGCPKQEKWISMHLRSLGVPVAIGIGATIDFLAGRVVRAPVWMRKTGTEWFFRLMQEPRRLFWRYFSDFFVVQSSMFQHFARFRTRGPTGTWQQSELVSASGERVHHVRVSGVFEKSLIVGPQGLGLAARAAVGHWILDVSKVSALDAGAIGLICDVWRRVREARKHLVLVSPSSAVRRALEVMQLEGAFTVEPDVESALHRINQSKATSQWDLDQPRTSAGDVL